MTTSALMPVAVRRPPTPPRQGVARVSMLPGLHADHVSQVSQVSQPSQADRDIPVAATQGTLALDLDPFPGMPRTPELRVVTGARQPIDAWAARFAQAVVEVIAGDRSLTQLIRWTTPQVYTDLVRRTAALNSVTPVDERRHTLRAQVRSVHLFSPTATSAEVSVHVRHGERSRAIAGRIECEESRWRCTALQFG